MQLGQKEIYEKYLRFKENIDVDLNPKLKWCPNRQCSRFVKKQGRGDNSRCECGTNVCFKCGEISHPGLGCQDYDAEFLEWRR